jgi:hypothetical protein
MRQGNPGMQAWLKRAVLTRMFCALALVLLGFGSHAFAGPSADPYSREYQLPDGSYTSLCQPGDDKGKQPHGDAHHCDICIVAAGHLFAPPTAILARAPVFRPGEAIRFSAGANLKPVHSHHRLSRGPPLFA